MSATATIVRAAVSPRWLDLLADELLAIEVDTEVGSLCVALCEQADTTIELMNEPKYIGNLQDAITGQCHVWYFG